MYPRVTTRVIKMTNGIIKIRCESKTVLGKRCKNYCCAPNFEFCHIHTPETRCAGINLNGEQCKRPRTTGNTFCNCHNLNEQCGICLDIIDNIYTMEKCKHSFCKKCIFDWLFEHNTCPMCRTPGNVSEFIHARRFCLKNNMYTRVIKFYAQFPTGIEIPELVILLIRKLFIQRREMSDNEFIIFKDKIKSNLHKVQNNEHIPMITQAFDIIDNFRFDLITYYFTRTTTTNVNKLKCFDLIF